MPLDPERYLVQAQRLAGTAEDDADYRSAINRAYYACHLVARDALFGVDAGGGKRPSHWAVIKAVAGHRGGEEDADDLRKLKRMREIVDYVTDSSHPEVQAVFAASLVSDWASLADWALAIAGALIPRLRALPPTG